MAMEKRECFCGNVFYANTRDLIKHCSLNCQKSGGEHCQRDGIKMKKDCSGMMEHGDRKSRLKDEGRKIGPIKGQVNTRQKETKEGKNSEEHLQNIERKSPNIERSSTIENVIQRERQSGEEKTRRKLMNTKERDMKQIESQSVEKSESEEGGQIPQSDYLQLYKTLNAENENSIQLLDNSSRQLIDLARGLAAPTKTDEYGEVIQRAPSQNIEVAIRCLSESRNMMKTKLDYIKFGANIVEKVFE